MGNERGADGDSGATDRTRGTDGASAERRSTATTRRTVLGSLAAGGAFAVGAGAVRAATPTPESGGAVTADEEGPSPPTGLTSSTPVASDGVELSWDGVADPCGSPVSQYVVTRDGERLTTVPAGVTRTVASADDAGGDSAVYGVAAVDEDGTASAPATVEAAPVVTDPGLALDLRPTPAEVAVGETARVDLFLIGATEQIPEFETFHADLRVATPCSTRPTGVSYSDAFETTHDEDPVNTDHIEVHASGHAGETAGEVRLGSLHLRGRRPGGSIVEAVRSGLAVDDEEVARLAPGWTTVSVTDGVEDRPAPPSDVSVEQGVSRSIDVFWSGLSDPCDSPISHYVVSVDGSDQVTVPAGVTAATVRPDGYEAVSVGVRAVDESGAASYPVKGEMRTPAIADPGRLLSVEPDRDAIAVGETVTAPIELSPILSSVPSRIDYEVTVEVTSPCAATISGIRCASGIVVRGASEVSGDGTTATLSATAFPDSAHADATLGVVELTGQSAGHTQIDVSLSGRDGGDALDAWPRWSTLAVEASDAKSTPTPAESDASTSQGTCGTGTEEERLIEDVNGNGESDFGDVIELFERLDEIEHPDRYDFNGNGQMDFGDVTALFERL